MVHRFHFSSHLLVVVTTATTTASTAATTMSIVVTIPMAAPDLASSRFNDHSVNKSEQKICLDDYQVFDLRMGCEILIGISANTRINNYLEYIKKALTAARHSSMTK